MAILATIGFMTYQGYISWSRDANRVMQLRDIHDGLELMSVSSKLPFPENMISLTASGSLYAYQGDAGDSIIKAIWYDGWWRDPEYDTPFIYALSKSGRDFQLMWYISDPEYISIWETVYADSIEYEELFIQTVWNPVWIIVDKITNTPFHKYTSESAYDIITGTGIIKLYTTSSEYLSSDSDDLTQIFPGSCNRIKELWKSQGSGEYTLSLISGKKQKVYCDMETDWWGWILVGRSSDSWSQDFWWLDSVWSYFPFGTQYSLWSNVKDIYFDEILFQTYTWKDIIEASWKQWSFDNTGIKNEISTYEAVEQICTIFQNAEWWWVPPCFESWGDISSTEGFVFKRLQDWWFHGIGKNWLTSNGGVTNEMRLDHIRFFIR
jgi:hypothetical protein